MLTYQGARACIMRVYARIAGAHEKTSKKHPLSTWGSAPNPEVFFRHNGSSNVCAAIREQKRSTEADLSHSFQCAGMGIPRRVAPQRCPLPLRHAGAKLHNPFDISKFLSIFAGREQSCKVVSTLSTLNALRLKLVCSPERFKGVPP